MHLYLQCIFIVFALYCISYNVDGQLFAHCTAQTPDAGIVFAMNLHCIFIVFALNFISYNVSGQLHAHCTLHSANS